MKVEKDTRHEHGYQLCPAHHLQHAEKLGAANLVLVAPDEWARGEFKVKELATREETTVAGVEGLLGHMRLVRTGNTT